MKVEIISITPDPELNIANCASTCYDSKHKDLDGARKMIKALIKSNHTAMLEHSSVTFRIHCSRAVSHEIVRHRIASYAQRSQRYVDESFPDYIIPEEIISNSYASIEYKKCMEQCWSSYKKLLEIGMKKEIARYVLPNATTTEICMTFNFRSLRNFFKLRCSKRAQPEIRILAGKMLEKMIELTPSCFEDLADENNLQNT